MHTSIHKYSLCTLFPWLLISNKCCLVMLCLLFPLAGCLVGCNAPSFEVPLADGTLNERSLFLHCGMVLINVEEVICRRLSVIDRLCVFGIWLIGFPVLDLCMFFRSRLVRHCWNLLWAPSLNLSILDCSQQTSVTANPGFSLPRTCLPCRRLTLFLPLPRSCARN